MIPWYLWLALTPVALAGLLWGGALLLFRAARRGVKRRWVVPLMLLPNRFVWTEVYVDIYVNHWLSRILPMTGITVRGRIYLDHPGDGPAGTTVTTREMLVHELAHIRQAERMGWRYLPTYLFHRCLGLLTGRGWAGHPMEREAIQCAAGWFAGDRGAIGELPASLLDAFPHRSKAS